MDFLQAPDWLVKLVPEGMRGLMRGPGWLVLLGLVVLVGLFLVMLVWRALGRRGGSADEQSEDSPLVERVGTYPPAPPSTGDRQLRVEGTPVRLRLVAVAPAGKADEIDESELPKMLEKVVPGLGEIFLADKPRVRVWPVQLSYEGFANQFHSNTILPQEKDEPTPWVVLAGRVKLGKQQIMLGLAAVAVKPTTIGRRTLDSHEWPTVVRVRVRD
jgi:hypothetical protein